MIKEIIYFDDGDLFGKCERRARENKLLKGSDFVVFSLENYFKKNNENISWKKPVDLWIDCRKEADKLGTTVPEFIEAICHDAVGDPMPEAHLPMTPDELKESQRSLRQKIAEMIRLPVGK